MISPAIKTVCPGDDFTLSIKFDNGESGVLDVKPMLSFGVFQRLKDPATFRQVRLTFDTVEWPGGIDLDPEYVYAKVQRDAAKRGVGIASENCARAAGD